MKNFQTLKSLVKEREELDWDAWLYCNIVNWERDANNTSIYYVTEDDAMEYDEDEDTGNPSFCKELGIEPFLEFQTFNDILDRSKSNDIESIIDAINYYRINDTFKG